MKDEEEISRALASLKTVDAPDNFEGGVRERIAQRRAGSSSSRPTLLLVAKFAFPMLLLLVIGGFLILSNEQQLSDDMVPSIENGSSDVAFTDDSQPKRPSISSTGNSNSSNEQSPVNRVGGKSRNVSQGGSEDIALTHDDSTVFPDGVDPRKAVATNRMPQSERSISPSEALSMIGIASNCSSTGCAATAVREGSIAALAGIQNGDLISAIDGRSINSSRVVTAMFTVNELTLVRSGRKMTVSVARR